MRPPGKPHGEHGHHGHWAGGRVPKGNVRGLLLAALLDGPAHGYELMRRLEGQASGRWRPSPGSVYPLLQLLEPSLRVMIDKVPQARSRILTAQRHLVAALQAQDESAAETWMARHIRDFKRGYELAGIDLTLRLTAA